MGGLRKPGLPWRSLRIRRSRWAVVRGRLEGRRRQRHSQTRVPADHCADLRMRTVCSLELLDALRQAEHSPRHAPHAFLIIVSHRPVNRQFHCDGSFFETESQAGRMIIPRQSFVQNVSVDTFGQLLDITPVESQHVVLAKSRRQLDTARQRCAHAMKTT